MGATGCSDEHENGERLAHGLHDVRSSLRLADAPVDFVDEQPRKTMLRSGTPHKASGGPTIPVHRASQSRMFRPQQADEISPMVKCQTIAGSLDPMDETLRTQL